MPNQPTIAEIRDRLVKEPLVRTFTIERGGMTVDEDTRTVNLAFASDKPIQQWSWEVYDYMELALSMKKGAMRTDRLKSGAPLLMDHDTRDVVGVIEAFSIDKDGMARADVRFGKGTRASEVYQDVIDGIRQNVSVGFMVHEMHLEKERKGQPNLYRSDDWEPYEVSIVSVPADISVGVGRSLETPPAELQVSDDQQRSISTDTEKIMSDKHDNTPETPVVDTRTAAQIAREEIGEAANALGKPELAPAFHQKRLLDGIESEPTLNEFKAFARTQIPANVPVPVMDPTTAARMGGGGQEVELARTLPRFGKLKAFKGEGAERRAHDFGQFVLAGPLGSVKAREFCSNHGIKIERAQSEGLNEKGGYFVPEDFGNDLIDLIETYGVFRSHAKIRPMTRDTASDPRIVGELDAYFVGESSTGTESDFETDRVNLTAKKLMTLVTFSSELSEDAVISIGDQVALMSARAFAKKEDECGFNGDGSATYGNIIGVREKIKNLSGTIANIAGLQVGTGNLYSELVLADFRGVVAKLPEYADNGSGWYCSRSFYWNVMVAALLAGGGVTATEIENARNQQFLGYPVYFSQVMPKTEANSQVCALFGDLAMGATLGDRRQYSIALSEHARFTADDIVFKATSRFDINVHSVGNASGTAADRVPGPIVGLITAAS